MPNETEANLCYANNRVALALVVGDIEDAKLWASRVTELAKQLKQEREAQHG